MRRAVEWCAARTGSIISHMYLRIIWHMIHDVHSLCMYSLHFTTQYVLALSSTGVLSKSPSAPHTEVLCSALHQQLLPECPHVLRHLCCIRRASACDCTACTAKCTACSTLSCWRRSERLSQRLSQQPQPNQLLLPLLPQPHRPLQPAQQQMWPCLVPVKAAVAGVRLLPRPQRNQQPRRHLPSRASLGTMSSRCVEKQWVGSGAQLLIMPFVWPTCPRHVQCLGADLRAHSVACRCQDDVVP